MSDLKNIAKIFGILLIIFVGMTRKGKKVKSEDMYYKLKCRPNCHS